MGRGLSPLQKFILEKAYDHEQIMSSLVCEQFFGWPAPERQITSSENYNRYPHIAKNVQASVKASINRAFRRLEERGLVKRGRGYKFGLFGFGAYVKITKEGADYLGMKFIDRTLSKKEQEDLELFRRNIFSLAKMVKRR